VTPGGRQAKAALGSPRGAEPFPQGLHRSGLAANDRGLHRVPGERLCPLRRGSEAVGIDNLKAPVSRADWHDPEIHPKLQSFARHYGTVFLPTKPYTPQHRGKFENGVKYVKRMPWRAGPSPASSSRTTSCSIGRPGSPILGSRHHEAASRQAVHRERTTGADAAPAGPLALLP